MKSLSETGGFFLILELDQKLKHKGTTEKSDLYGTQANLRFTTSLLSIPPQNETLQSESLNLPS